MRKTKTVGGKSAFRMTFTMAITRGDFAKALAEHSISRGGIEFYSLGKDAAKKILADRIQWYGRSGANTSEAMSVEQVDFFNTEFEKALEWIDRNYPYLNHKTT
jgi:hypothetical protein